MTKAVGEYKSPSHKIIAMLHAGRDKLRKKYADLREKLRTAENQVRAVEKSREMWRQRAEAAEADLVAVKKREQMANKLFRWHLVQGIEGSVPVFELKDCQYFLFNFSSVGFVHFQPL